MQKHIEYLVGRNLLFLFCFVVKPKEAEHEYAQLLLDYVQLGFEVFQFFVGIGGRTDADGETATASHLDLDAALACHDTGCNLVRVGSCSVVGIFAVGIKCSHVASIAIEEVEVYFQRALLLVGNSANKPILGTFLFASCQDVLTGLGSEVTALVPINSYVFDELEGIHIHLVVLGEVGRHLQGRVEGNVRANWLQIVLLQ